jgi:hypothetical protein
LSSTTSTLAWWCVSWAVWEEKLADAEDYQRTHTLEVFLVAAEVAFLPAAGGSVFVNLVVVVLPSACGATKGK